MSGELILQDSVDDVLVFVDVVNRASGCIDEGGNMVIINEPNPNTPTTSQYEVISNKVTGFTETNANNVTYATTLAIVTYVNEFGDKFYRYTQNTPSNIWVIVHGLGRRPSVIIIDSAGTTVEGQITHNSDNQVTVEFSVGFSGYAELN